MGTLSGHCHPPYLSMCSSVLSLARMASFSSLIFLSLAVVDWYWASLGTEASPELEAEVKLPPAWPRTEAKTRERKLKSESMRVSCHCRLKYWAKVGLDSGLGRKGRENQSFHSE